MIKTGSNVLVSVRRAMEGKDLGRLRATVEREFLTLTEDDRNLRTVLTKLEAGFARGFHPVCSAGRPMAAQNKPSLGEQGGHPGRRKLKARRLGDQGIWFGVSLMGPHRLVGVDSNAPRHRARRVARQAPPRTAFVDAGAARGRFVHRLPDGVALGVAGIRDHAPGTGRRS